MYGSHAGYGVGEYSQDCHSYSTSDNCDLVVNCLYCSIFYPDGIELKLLSIAEDVGELD